MGIMCVSDSDAGTNNKQGAIPEVPAKRDVYDDIPRDR